MAAKSNLTYLINFRSKRMQERWLYFLAVAERYQNRMTAHPDSSGRVLVDYVALNSVHVSAHYDIHRYKVMHLQDPHKQLSDAVKRSAYFAKWILKHRPFSIERTKRNLFKFDRGVFLNEDFALRWAHVNLEDEMKLSKPTFSMPTLSAKKMKELMYDFHYRLITEDALIHIFQDHFDTVAGHQKFHR